MQYNCSAEDMKKCLPLTLLFICCSRCVSKDVLKSHHHHHYRIQRAQMLSLQRTKSCWKETLQWSRVTGCETAKPTEIGCKLLGSTR